MSRTIGGVSGESDITSGIQTKGPSSTKASRDGNASKTRSITKSKFVLLLTRDIELDQELATAAAAIKARLIIARTVGVALEIIHQRDRQLDLVVIDFGNGTGEKALLRALTTSSAELPIVALTSSDSDYSAVFAAADTNACCLTKPINAAELEMVIRVLGRSRIQADAAQSKQRIPRTSNPNHTSRTPGMNVRRVKDQTSLRTEA